MSLVRAHVLQLLRNVTDGELASTSEPGTLNRGTTLRAIRFNLEPRSIGIIG
jgi:hypothetical protein